MLKTIEARESADTIHAIVETNLGSFKIQLFHKRAPKTVQNFIDLAEGTTEWLHPRTRAKQNVRMRLFSGSVGRNQTRDLYDVS